MVKKELTKADNLKDIPKRYEHYLLLMQYIQESMVLRHEIIDNCDNITEWKKM